jgi:hypothetical protein
VVPAVTDQVAAALGGLERPPGASKKFRGYGLALAALVLLAAITCGTVVLVAHAAPATPLPELALAMAWPLGVLAGAVVALAGAYIGSTSWQEHGVRIAAVLGTAPPSRFARGGLVPRDQPPESER